MYVSNAPPTLAIPVVVEDSEANNKPPTKDDVKGHEDTAATTNETMAPPKATNKTPATAAAADKK
jgi:hypothetical protein